MRYLSAVACEALSFNVASNILMMTIMLMRCFVQKFNHFYFIIIIILFVHKNNFIKTRQPTTRKRDRQG